MKWNLLAALFLGLALFAWDVRGQSEQTPLDKYIADAETFVVAKCLSSGPVNILFKAIVDLDVLIVLKGDPKLKKLTEEIGGGLIPGETYLIRIPDYKKTKEKSTFGNEGANVIPVASNENIEELRLLSPRIVVLRTMNSRIYRLENAIRRDTYELDAIKAIKKGN